MKFEELIDKHSLFPLEEFEKRERFINLKVFLKSKTPLGYFISEDKNDAFNILYSYLKNRNRLDNFYLKTHSMPLLVREHQKIINEVGFGSIEHGNLYILHELIDRDDDYKNINALLISNCDIAINYQKIMFPLNHAISFLFEHDCLILFHFHQNSDMVSLFRQNFVYRKLLAQINI